MSQDIGMGRTCNLQVRPTYLWGRVVGRWVGGRGGVVQIAQLSLKRRRAQRVPRQTLGWVTPAEALNALLSNNLNHAVATTG